MISISHYLYRKSGKWATAALLAVLLLSTFGAAQIRDRTEHKPADQDQQAAKKSDKKNKRGPRAIAVVEFLPGGGTRLVPIALWMDGRFYDASMYGAHPEPMALEPETLYQALAYGEPAGWFTVTTPQNVKGSWVAEGQWKPETPVEARLAAQAAKQPKPKPNGHDVLSDDQGPPVLRRPGTSDTASGGAQSSAPASSSEGKSTSSGTSTADSNAPPKSDNDSDRPTLKASPSGSSPAPSSSKPTLGDNTQQAKAQAPASSAPPAASPDEDDPNRPILRRGKPSQQPTVNTADTASSHASVSKTAKPVAGGDATAAPGIAAKGPQAPRAYAAISDAGYYETRSLLYGMATGEKQSLGEPMSRMAMDEIRKYASKHNGPAPPKTAAIADYDLRGFDLDYSNSPTLVLSAKLPVAPAKAAPGGEFDYFVTVVARVDLNGTPQKIFSVVTDRNHLDAFPRMQIVDAVDADANGRGDLLFRQYSDTGISYALYRVFPYQMEKIFEGGAGI